MDLLCHRKLNWLAGKENRMCIGQVGGVAMAQNEKRAEQNQERERSKHRKRSPFKAEALPKDGSEAEGAEPEQVNLARDQGAAT